MAAFGFSSGDNSSADLCIRAYECSRAIVNNMPRLNKKLARKFPYLFDGIRIRMGISSGQAHIGVVSTDNMANAVALRCNVCSNILGRLRFHCKPCPENGR